MRRSGGFTLVEMLIALAIFGMITAAGVTLLTVTVRTQESSERQLGELGELRRLGALLTADLAQAAARPRRDGEGRPRPAFRGSDGDGALLLALVRRGGDEESESRHGAVQRIEYRLVESRIERLAFHRVDGEARAVAMPLIDGVRGARLRYRDREGDWRESWDPTDPVRLPRAVELVTDSDTHGSVRMVFTVGGSGL